MNMLLLNGITRFRPAALQIRDEVRGLDLPDPEVRRFPSRGGDQEIRAGLNHDAGLQFHDHIAAVIGEGAHRADSTERLCFGRRGLPGSEGMGEVEEPTRTFFLGLRSRCVWLLFRRDRGSLFGKESASLKGN
jgi:hypothetical protein